MTHEPSILSIVMTTIIPTTASALFTTHQQPAEQGPNEEVIKIKPNEHEIISGLCTLTVLEGQCFPSDSLEAPASQPLEAQLDLEFTSDQKPKPIEIPYLACRLSAGPTGCVVKVQWPHYEKRYTHVS